MIPYGKQSISDEDIREVVNILCSNFITQGPAIDRFETAIAKYCGVKYAVAVSNATAALHIACMALELGTGDILYTSPNTFVASANCGLYCNASVDFVDIDPYTYNISVSELATKLEKAEKNGTLPKVVIPVHFSGQSCEMQQIGELSKKYGYFVIEDASHAIGGKYMDKPVGCCEYSDLSVFSFHPVKIITTGEGGIITTNRKDLYDKLIRLRSHGITREQELMTQPSEGPWYYQQIELGFNYRMTDIQAALGWSQMKRLDEYVTRRNQLVENYRQLLQPLPIRLPTVIQDAYSAFHLYVIRLKTDRIKKSHKEVFTELRNAGVGVNLHYIPVHTQPYYRNLGFKSGDFPVAEKYYSEAISLPMFYDLTEQQQRFIANTLNDILS